MKKNTWKKLMSLALGAMMMLSLLTGCGSKTEDSAPADSTPAEETPAESAAAASLLEKVKTSGKLVVGTEAQYAPYEFKDLNASFAGCDMWLRLLPMAFLQAQDDADVQSKHNNS